METTVRPGSVDPAEIDSFIEGLGAVGQTPLLVGPDGASVELPVEIHAVLLRIASELQIGNGVTVVPVSAVLTTAEAAEMLNVSRPHIVKLLDQGELPHHMAGTHRRVKVADLLEFRDRRDHARSDALAEMHQIGDESGMDL
jgi:excisionase family DNA binding protein